MSADNTLTASNLTYDLLDSEIEDFYSCIVRGTWDSGTVTQSVSNDGTNWVAVTDGAWSEDTAFNFLVSFPFVKFVISGGLGSESVVVEAKQIRHRR